MSSLSAGGTDWIDNTITNIRFDLTNATGVAVDIDWIAIGGNGYGTQYFEDDTIFDGNVGIGETSPSQKLHVNGRVQVDVAADNVRMDLINSSESAFRLRTYNNGTNEGNSTRTRPFT